jgi:peptidyl-prolyl cis-trans isomerase B (cyclophilin B)
MKRLILIGAIVLSMALAGCAPSNKESANGPGAPQDSGAAAAASSKPVATVTMKSGKTMEIELYPDKARNTVNNFIELSQKGFYDGLTFHRVISGFMIQGGDPKGDGSGGPGYSIKGEFAENKFPNDLKHVRGVISMARTMEPDTAGSQFFIMHQDAPSLDGKYAAFGKVIKGIEVVDEIASVKTGANDKPEKDVVIKSIKISLNGYVPAAVEKIAE